MATGEGVVSVIGQGAYIILLTGGMSILVAVKRDLSVHIKYSYPPP